MYQKLADDFHIQHPSIPKKTNIELGTGIRNIRLRIGMTQDELAKNAGLKLSALRTLENDYAQFTKLENLGAIAKAMDVEIEDILTESLERFSGNFFPIRLNEPPKKVRYKKKKRPNIWLKQQPLVYDGFQVSMTTPSMKEYSHFCFCLIDIARSQKIENLKLDHAGQVSGFVQRGSIRISYGEKEEYRILGNQGFTLRGDKNHSIENIDNDNPVRLFLTFALLPKDGMQILPSTGKSKDSLSVGDALKSLRKRHGMDKKLLSMEALQRKTGIHAKTLDYLQKSDSKKQIIHWDKIDKISRAFGLSTLEYISLSRGKDKGYVKISKSLDRAMIDYRHYLGVQIKSALFPSTIHNFTIAEVYVEPKKGIRRFSWKRQDKAMIALYVEDGTLNVHIGKDRKTELKENESLYFDASLGYLFTNPDTKPCKFILASYPAIIF